MLSNKEIYQKEIEQEAKGEFDVHIDDPDLSLMVPVTEDFPYVKRGFLAIRTFFQKIFVVNPFVRKINKSMLHTSVVGKENLRGIDSAILTCNHVFIFDCLAAIQAVKPHKLNITAAEFNNRSDRLGKYMRAGGLLPMSSNLRAMKKFNNAISYYLKKKHYVMFYPEQAMWLMYEKPRPNKIGAFHYAVKNHVPVIPMFITFKGRGTYDADGIEEKDFVVNILKPIYEKPELDEKANMQYLLDENYKAWKECYESFYGKELVYNINKEGK